MSSHHFLEVKQSKRPGDGRSAAITAVINDTTGACTSWSLSFEPLRPGQEPATISPPDAFLQDLVDQLFAAGFTPKGLKAPKLSDSSDSFLAGKVEAMQEHLADLRRMAFGEPKGPDQPQTPGGEY